MNEERKKLINDNNVLIDYINLNPNEVGNIEFFINFLTEELTDKTHYKYHIIQRDILSNAIVGGVTLEINKTPRPIFMADAGGVKEVDKNEPIIITASHINEPALYNWYDATGTLIFQGKDLTITNAVAEKYKLEVIATADGFKDYAEVEIKIKPSTLGAILPNPVITNATISYKLNETNSAYLMVLGYYGGVATSNNYILDLNSSQINLNLNNYSSGFYTVALVCNGQIVDAKTLVKQ